MTQVRAPVGQIITLRSVTNRIAKLNHLRSLQVSPQPANAPNRGRRPLKDMSFVASAKKDIASVGHA